MKRSIQLNLKSVCTTFIILLSVGIASGQVLGEPDRDIGIDPGNGSGNCSSSEKRYRYRDADGDGKGGELRLLVCPQTPGFSDLTGDCDDSNPEVRDQLVWYKDMDDDGVGAGILGFLSCTDPSTGSQSYSLTNDDCNDNNDRVKGPRKWYLSTDGDMWGDYFSPHPDLSCTAPTSNIPGAIYVDNFVDCRDDLWNPPTSPPLYRWYQDFDRDELGDPNNFVNSCNPPLYGHWVLNADDYCPHDTGETSNNGCPTGNVEEEPWNTIKVITYDLTNDPIGNPIGKTKSYFDELGKQVQNLTLDFKTNKTWASQTIYDSQGRPAVQTMAAPAYQQETFMYKENFVKKPNDQAVETSDFESDPDNPTPIGDQPLSLGWFYSQNNNDTTTDNHLLDITDYPYTHTIYSDLNLGAVKKVQGGNKINGQWKNGHSFTMVAGQELVPQYAFGSSDYDSANYKILKSISRGVHGVETVVFTDTEGKVLASARSGLRDDGSQAPPHSNTIAIGEQGFVDVHVPEGILGYNLNRPPGVNVKTYNLITEELVTVHSTIVGNGFYRIAVIDLENYIPGSITVTYQDNYYDYSLNYYDDLGRLYESSQPLRLANGQELKTSFKYNTLGLLIETESPDEGKSEFKYRQDGQIRYSQNEVQATNNEISFTNYDDQGRPVESGVLEGITNFSSLDADAARPAGITREVTSTHYDFLYSRVASALPDGYEPQNLAGNVAWTTNSNRPEIAALFGSYTGTTTYYSYDVYGRVTWMVQLLEGLPHPKSINYTYDPLNGNVISVRYINHLPPGPNGMIMAGDNDYFEHRYHYDDSNNNLTKVETRAYGESTFHEEAVYDYYENGSLKNIRLAGGLQKIDYVYNLNGQLKAINHHSLDENIDPTAESNENDFFGMTIDYHDNDYMRSGAFSPMTGRGDSRYDGNIKGIWWRHQGEVNPSAFLYSYNKNKWLKSADFQSYSNSLGDYDVSGVTYDANGNIQTLTRKQATGSGPGGTDRMDELDYSYDAAKPNQLDHVTDAVTQITSGDIGSQGANAYEYNDIGQLIENRSENLQYFYNASGLVTRVRNTLTGYNLVQFFYDDKGKRYRKTTFDGQGTAQNHTYYVRDAGGSVMAIYENGALAEQPIYGSGRIGVYKSPSNNSSAHLNLYQLTDHLGNVRAVISKDRRSTSAAALVSRMDYYPFGMQMPNRTVNPNGYRYGYQGEFAENEETSETGATNSFELRLWDARIGRWLTTDPAGQYASPYLGMGNNPINGVDPDGAKYFDWVLGSDGKYFWDENVTHAGDEDLNGNTYIGRSRLDVEKHFASKHPILDLFGVKIPMGINIGRPPAEMYATPGSNHLKVLAGAGHGMTLWADPDGQLPHAYIEASASFTRGGFGADVRFLGTRVGLFGAASPTDMYNLGFSADSSRQGNLFTFNDFINMDQNTLNDTWKLGGAGAVGLNAEFQGSQLSSLTYSALVGELVTKYHLDGIHAGKISRSEFGLNFGLSASAFYGFDATFRVGVIFPGGLK